METVVTVITSLAHLAACVGQVDHTVTLYFAAAVVARFWHEKIWIVYLAMAMTAAVMPGH